MKKLNQVKGKKEKQKESKRESEVDNVLIMNAIPIEV